MEPPPRPSVEHLNTLHLRLVDCVCVCVCVCVGVWGEGVGGMPLPL